MRSPEKNAEQSSNSNSPTPSPHRSGQSEILKKTCRQNGIKSASHQIRSFITDSRKVSSRITTFEKMTSKLQSKELVDAYMSGYYEHFTNKGFTLEEIKNSTVITRNHPIIQQIIKESDESSDDQAINTPERIPETARFIPPYIPLIMNRQEAAQEGFAAARTAIEQHRQNPNIEITALNLENIKELLSFCSDEHRMIFLNAYNAKLQDEGLILEFQVYDTDVIQTTTPASLLTSFKPAKFSIAAVLEIQNNTPDVSEEEKQLAIQNALLAGVKAADYGIEHKYTGIANKFAAIDEADVARLNKGYTPEQAKAYVKGYNDWLAHKDLLLEKSNPTIKIISNT